MCSSDLEDCIYYRIRREINLNSTEELADAIEAAGIPCEWKLTESGKRSLSKDSIEYGLRDAELKNLLRYRALLAEARTSLT